MPHPSGVSSIFWASNSINGSLKVRSELQVHILSSGHMAFSYKPSKQVELTRVSLLNEQR